MICEPLPFRNRGARGSPVTHAVREFCMPGALERKRGVVVAEPAERERVLGVLDPDESLEIGEAVELGNRQAMGHVSFAGAVVTTGRHVKSKLRTRKQLTRLSRHGWEDLSPDDRSEPACNHEPQQDEHRYPGPSCNSAARVLGNVH